MATKNTITIDQNLNTALLILYVNNIEVTRYTYSNNSVTLSERTMDVDIPINDLKVNVKDIMEFRGLILSKLNPEWVKSNFWYRLEYENLKEKLKMDNNGTTIIDAKNNNNVINFKARPQLVISYFLFHKFTDALDHFIQEITRSF